MSPAHYIALAGALGAAFVAGWAFGIWWQEREQREEERQLREWQEIDREYRETQE